jgi:probable rRNA maturation factor
VSNTPDSNRPDSCRPDHDSLRISIIVDDIVRSPIDEKKLQQAVAAAAADRGYHRGEIGIRVTNDTGIHQINRDHLGHDYPTDVISFAYHADKPAVEGELIVSVDTASERANEFGWPVAHELALYVVHGTLHITGMDDQDPSHRTEMRDAEQRIMMQLGIDDIVRFGADETGPSIVEGSA